MSVRLILPKQAVWIEETDTKLFFLGGPILGGDDWQADAIRILAELAPGSYVACPCRYPNDHPLYPWAVEGENADRWRARGLMRFREDPEPFTRQTYWERFYLEQASRKGCVIFWLPAESHIHPRPPEKGPYARDTYGELGEWRMRMRHEKARVVIGGKRDFPGMSVIDANYRAVLGDHFVIEPTLRETIIAAIEAAQKAR